MELKPLVKKREIERTLTDLTQILRADTNRYKVHVGWRGGGKDCIVFWNSSYEFWSVINPVMRPSRHVLFFGPDDPHDYKNLRISCEVNPPRSGSDRRCAGIFVKDSRDVVFLAHTGKIGGGYPGVGKRTFLRSSYAGTLEPVQWPDGVITQVLVLGPVNSRLPELLGHFIHSVQKFKNKVRSGKFRETKTSALSYKPEFYGQRRSYEVGTVESRCTHGLIVEALVHELEHRKLKYHNNRFEDLVLAHDATGTRSVLFEIKTDTSTSSIYSGVGQLMLHTANGSPRTKKVLVVPDKPAPQTAVALRSIGIYVVIYSRRKADYAFKGLAEILGG